MGHGEEVGIIPRFSEELFQRIDLCAEQNVSRLMNFFNTDHISSSCI